MEILKATSYEDISRCEKVILELRPHLHPENLWEQYQKQLAENYQILYIWDEAQAVAFVGYRLQHLFYSGKTLYIDDLCTLPTHRGKGYAGKLLDKVFEIAEQQQCDCVTLDSGHHRHDAHRLYLNKGFRIASHHFYKALKI